MNGLCCRGNRANGFGGLKVFCNTLLSIREGGHDFAFGFVGLGFGVCQFAMAGEAGL